MPVQNTRVVVLGTPKADKDFALFDNDRQEAQKALERLGGDAEKLARELRKAARADNVRGGVR